MNNEHNIMLVIRKHVAKSIASVAAQLGVGHSERVYQKALSIELYKNGISHTTEHHVPIRYDNMNIGSERADILVEDARHLLYVIELKATEASIWKRGKPPSTGNHFPPAHVQLLKYIRFLGHSERRRVCTGFVVNFQQTLLYTEQESRSDGAALSAACPVEMDMYDAQTHQWSFGLSADSAADSPPPIAPPSTGSSPAPSVSIAAWTEPVIIETLPAHSLESKNFH